MEQMNRFTKNLHYFSPTGKAGLIILSLFFLMAVFSARLTTHPHDVSSGKALMPPCFDHVLGTDDIGVDLWSQLVYGARISLLVGFLTAGISGCFGALVGMFAGYTGGWMDRFFMRIIDGMMVLPDLPVMIVLAAFFGPGLAQVILVLSLFSWVFTARIVRSRVLVIKQKEYVIYARISGAGPVYLMRKHLFPEVLPLVWVSMIRLAGKAIVAEAGLSFLGLGDPTSRSWGLIIYHATRFPGIYYTRFWTWWLLYPFLALSGMVLALAFVCRDLETLADPRMNQKISGGV
ncbi:MAG: ABC transporter permease [Proteobacteria bacterium]|nr:ABC transporter permease [Pseudomonadota bacterium]